MFSDEQKQALTAPLDRSHVKQRSQAGRSLSYIEGWHAIAEANRIFGFDGWHRRLLDMNPCGEPQQLGDKWRVRFWATVEIKVVVYDKAFEEITRHGTGYGSGVAKDLGDAYESAIKEAETDAMKRALMTFGNPFGLALYDKTQANVADREPEKPKAAHADFANKDGSVSATKTQGGLAAFEGELQACGDYDSLIAFLADDRSKAFMAAVKEKRPDTWAGFEDYPGLHNIIEARKEALARKDDARRYAA